MSVWSRIRHTGERTARAYLLAEIDPDGAVPIEPDGHYFRVFLAQMHLARESTFTARWLPGAHVQVSYARAGAAPVGYSKVLRPDPEQMAQGVLINYPVTDLVPYRGGVVELSAALFGLQAGTKLDLAVDVLQAVSALPLPAVGAALGIAQQVTSTAKTLVEASDGAVHLDLHQSYVASGGVGTENVLRPLYVAALLATGDDVEPGALRVVGDRLHVAADGGPVRPLTGWDFLLLKIEGRRQRDDFWLPDFDLLLSKAMRALRQGNRDLAAQYRNDATDAVWESPALTWVDRDRIVDAVARRFAAAADAGLGAAAGPDPDSATELVRRYAPSVEFVVARGPLTRPASPAPAPAQ